MVRREIRHRHYALSTEKAYVQSVRGFVKFHGLKHPREMGIRDVEAFLSYLANDRQVSLGTHRQAWSALLFLYAEVLKIELPWMQKIGRPQSVHRLPVVLTVDEVRRTLVAMDGVSRTIAALLRGTGMRIMEALRLHVKDMDVERGVILDRHWQGILLDGKRVFDLASYQQGFSMILIWGVVALVLLCFTQETYCKQVE